VATLLRDPADGSLTPVPGGPTAVDQLHGPAALAASPDGRDLYLASPFDEAVMALAG
jgi:hypothetical protein